MMNSLDVKTGPLRWGILSTSNFAEKTYVPALAMAADAELVAIASRSQKPADEFAERCGIKRAYGSYLELLADGHIDVVYVPASNDLHVPLTLAAMECGKHVLCEKPMGLNAAELESLRPLASAVHIAEGFMVRQHRQWIEIRDLVRSGAIGALTHAHMTFAYTNVDGSNIRNNPAVGGGAMYDIGCYVVCATRWFFEAEPTSVYGVADRDPVFGTDRRFSGLLNLPEGRTCQFSVSTQSVPHQRVHLFGTKGRVEITIPFNQPQTDPIIYLTHFGESLSGLDAKQHIVPAQDQYVSLIDWFCKKVRNETPTPAGLDDAVRQAKVMDALFRSEKSGQVETV